MCARLLRLDHARRVTHPVTVDIQERAGEQHDHAEHEDQDISEACRVHERPETQEERGNAPAEREEEPCGRLPRVRTIRSSATAALESNQNEGGRRRITT